MARTILEVADLLKTADPVYVGSYRVRLTQTSFNGHRGLVLKRDDSATHCHPAAPSQLEVPIEWPILEEQQPEYDDLVLVFFSSDWKVLTLYFVKKEVSPC